MWYIFLVFIFMSCVTKRNYIDELSKPSPTEFDQYRRVVKTSGQENRKRYLYYNSIQYKNKYKRKD